MKAKFILRRLFHAAAEGTRQRRRLVVRLFETMCSRVTALSTDEGASILSGAPPLS